MKVQDAVKLMHTGDIFAVQGTGLLSHLIEEATESKFSHAAIFYRDGTVNMVAEENERDGAEGDVLNAGFQTVPLNQWLTQQTGPVYWGQSKDVVRQNPQKTLDMIEYYKEHGTAGHYGFLSLIPILISHLTGVDLRIPPWSEVCSSLDAEILQKDGDTAVKSASTPQDIANSAVSLTVLEV